MATWIGFLRAINLGASRKFAKADIAAAALEAGFTGVETYINTGNVRLETRLRSRARIETALEESFARRAGFEVPTICFTAAEVRAIAADAEELAPRRPDGDPRHYVSLLKHEPSADAVHLLEGRSTPEAVAVVRGRAAHLMLAGPYGTSRLSNVEVERALGTATNRNLSVIAALAQRWC